MEYATYKTGVRNAERARGGENKVGKPKLFPTSLNEEFRHKTTPVNTPN